MDTVIADPLPLSIAPAFDTAVLDSLLALGGAQLRVALCAQLQADFRRLHGAIAGDAVPAVARAAHELKGLAATVGAGRLADMARSLDASVDGLSVAARRVTITTVQYEIETVLAVLAAAQQGPKPV